MSQYVSAGLSLSQRTWDRLDEMAERWDDQESGVVGRSQVAREALPVGLDCIELTDSYSSRPLTRRERQGLIRQAIHDFEASEAADRGAEDVLVERLADVAGVDALALEAALVDLKRE